MRIDTVMEEAKDLMEAIKDLLARPEFADVPRELALQIVIDEFAHASNRQQARRRIEQSVEEHLRGAKSNVDA